MKQVLITGTSSGIGEALANHFIQKRIHVFGFSRKSSQKLVNSTYFSQIKVDLSDYEKVIFELKKIKGKLTNIDQIILNAGILGEIKELKDTSLEEINSIMEINVWSNKVFIEEIIKNKITPRQIIAISSGASINGNHGWNAYALSKCSLNMLIKLMSHEHPHTHFSSIAPGLVKTKMQDYLYDKVDSNKFSSVKRLQDAYIKNLIPFPENIAKDLILFFEQVRKFPSGGFYDIRDYV